MLQNTRMGKVSAAGLPTPAAQISHLAMGTVMAHRAYGPRAEEGLRAVRGEVARIEGLLSRFLPGSDISRLNRSAGSEPEPVSRETFTVLSKAVEFSRACPGCLDVTIAPLVRLWSRHKETASRPDAASIQQALALVDYRDLLLDPWEQTAGLRHDGQSVDLGGIGKGYAGDQALAVYRRWGITSACSNLGGNVVALGVKPDGSPWQVGIQHPREENSILGTVAVVDQTVVTSGDYQRCYTDQQGRRCHHILNPLTGMPADSGLISVTIVAGQSLAADALSTILFIAGMEKGLDLLRAFPHTEAILVDAALRVYVTNGLRCRFQAEQGINVTILD